jgi:hypothetical protein
MRNKRGNTDGVGPSCNKIEKEKPRDLRGGKDSPQREVGGMTYALDKTLKLIESVL